MAKRTSAKKPLRTASLKPKNPLPGRMAKTPLQRQAATAKRLAILKKTLPLMSGAENIKGVRKTIAGLEKTIKAQQKTKRAGAAREATKRVVKKKPKKK